MRVVPDLHVEWVEGEAVVLHPQTKQLHYLNSSAALVFALMEEVGFQEAMERLRAEFSEIEGMDTDLESVVADMLDRGLLIDD